MKKYILISCMIVSVAFAVNASDTTLRAARELASDGIITTAGGTNEVSSYRLSSPILRQEAIGIALKLAGISLDSTYRCRNFYSDTSESWVCRAAELGSEKGIISRYNTKFRPRDTISLGESMAIIMRALDIPLASDTSLISGSMPEWQKMLLATLTQERISVDIRNNGGIPIISYNPDKDTRPLVSSMNKPLTRGEFFILVTALKNRINSNTSTDALAHCLTYTDGCNECSVSPNGMAACTKRACVWQGIPACYTCESGYVLQDKRCVRETSTTCKKEGEAVSNGSLPPQYQYHYSCCAGLTEVGPKEANIVGAPNICAKIGDKYCDMRYESSVNSSDCRTSSSFDVSICQGYNDGCNTCSHAENGQDICTMMYCETPKNPYCTSYVPFGMTSQSRDTVFLKKILSEIKSYTSDLSCDNSSQCKWKKVGSAPCGGASAAVPYSSKNISEDLLTKKSQYYTDAEKLYNTTYGIMGICALMDEPLPMSCINSKCQ